MELLAHSAKPERNIPVHTYKCHISEVIRLSGEKATRLLIYYKSELDDFLEVITAASCFHDLGKLDIKNQEVLFSGTARKLEVSHEDAGSALLK